MFNKANAILKEDACMKFYYETKLLYIETDASGVVLEAALLQTRTSTTCLRDKVSNNYMLTPIAFSNKSFTRTEKYRI